MNIKRNILKSILIGVISFSLTACDDRKDKVVELTKEKEKKVKLPKPEWDSRLSAVELDAGEWYQLANDDDAAAYNIGNVYFKKLKDHKNALRWYLYSNYIKPNPDTFINMGLVYEDLNNSNKALKSYTKAYLLKDKDAGSYIGLLLKKQKKYMKQ